MMRHKYFKINNLFDTARAARIGHNYLLNQRQAVCHEQNFRVWPGYLGRRPISFATMENVSICSRNILSSSSGELDAGVMPTH